MLIFRFASHHYGFWLIAALGALLGLKQFLTAESPLKMMKNAFYFTLKTLFILKIFKFLSCILGHVGKQLE